MVYKKTAGDICLNIFIFLFVGFLVVLILYPLIYVFSMSISDPREVLTGNVTFLPKGFSLEAFKTVLNNPDIYKYYGNTLWYTVVGTALSVVATVLLGYPLSRKQFSGRKPLMLMVVFTMFFNAGMIPLYLVVVNLNLYNTRWALILPTLTAAWYVIVARSYFEGMP